LAGNSGLHMHMFAPTRALNRGLPLSLSFCRKLKAAGQSGGTVAGEYVLQPLHLVLSPEKPLQLKGHIHVAVYPHFPAEEGIHGV